MQVDVWGCGGDKVLLGFFRATCNFRCRLDSGVGWRWGGDRVGNRGDLMYTLLAVSLL